MTHLALMLFALAAPAADKADKPDEAKKAPTARVVLTAPVACLHCDFGEGDGCTGCLKLDEKTPLRLEGKPAETLHELRFNKVSAIAEGTLTLNKDKKPVLTLTAARIFTDKDKGTAPAVGEARVTGVSCCGKCDLNITKVCTVSFRNGTAPIVLSGKLAEVCSEEGTNYIALGKLFVDKTGVLRLEATKLDEEKPAKQDK
jgi:hypothetical protein